MKKLIAITCCVLFTLLVYAQQKTLYKLNPDLINFFNGKWHGHGKFANGREIMASLNFSLSLDSAWLSCTHTDELPNKYKALLMWSSERKTGEFIAYNFDNFQGHRRFTSDGWNNGKLVLVYIKDDPTSGKFYEHFIYEKLSANTFRMSYETSRDGVSWRLGDYLIFEKST